MVQELTNSGNCLPTLRQHLPLPSPCSRLLCSLVASCHEQFLLGEYAVIPRCDMGLPAYAVPLPHLVLLARTSCTASLLGQACLHT